MPKIIKAAKTNLRDVLITEFVTPAPAEMQGEMLAIVDAIVSDINAYPGDYEGFVPVLGVGIHAAAWA